MDSAPNASRRDRLRRLVYSAALGTGTAGIAATGPAGATALVVGGMNAIPAQYGPVLATIVPLVTLALVGVASMRADGLTRLDRHAIRVGYTVGAAVFLLVFLNPLAGGWRDASAYYTLGLENPYRLAYELGGVRYAPPFFQVIEPFRSLSWPAFLFLWTAGQLALLWVIAGPMAALLLLVPVVALEAWYSNINLLFALVITWGFRWPALWSIVLFTKITPGVGLIWFAVRREWRSLILVLASTVPVGAVSLLVAPGLWMDWLRAIPSSTAPDRVNDIVPLPFRVALAAVVVAWGGMRDRPWTVPLGAAVAMPVLWPATLSVLVALVPLSRRPSENGNRRAVDWAIRPSVRRQGTQ